MSDPGDDIEGLMANIMSFAEELSVFDSILAIVLGLISLISLIVPALGWRRRRKRRNQQRENHDRFVPTRLVVGVYRYEHPPLATADPDEAAKVRDHMENMAAILTQSDFPKKEEKNEPS